MSSTHANGSDPFLESLQGIRDKLSAGEEARELRAHGRRTEQAERAKQDRQFLQLREGSLARTFAELILDEFPSAGLPSDRKAPFTSPAELVALDKLRQQMPQREILKAEGALNKGRLTARAALGRAHKAMKREQHERRTSPAAEPQSDEQPEGATTAS